MKSRSPAAYQAKVQECCKNAPSKILGVRKECHCVVVKGLMKVVEYAAGVRRTEPLERAVPVMLKLFG